MMTEKYFTLVYEHTERFAAHNPFTTETPWGVAIGASVGDLMHEIDVLAEALRKISCGSSDAEVIAQDALDEVENYIIEQRNIQPSSRIQDSLPFQENAA